MKRPSRLRGYKERFTRDWRCSPKRALAWIMESVVCRLSNVTIPANAFMKMQNEWGKDFLTNS